WALAQKRRKRSAEAVEVQLQKELRLVRVVEKGLARDA
ncbi:tRNA epoxyqueuosine(34) reductase QueG, partial [Klebsiella pneumoniae]